MSTVEHVTNSQTIAPAQLETLLSYVFQSQQLPYRRKYNRTEMSKLKKKLQYYEDVKWGVKEQFTEANINRAVTELTSLQQIIAYMISEATTLQTTFQSGRKRAIANAVPHIARKFPITINESYLGIFVGPITIRHNGEDVYIGNFTIQMDVSVDNLNGVRLFNPENSVAGIYAHPHVRDGYGCYGNIKELVRGLYKQGELDDLTDLLVDFLKSYSGDNPYRKIAHWKGGYCSYCLELKLDCLCGRIGESTYESATTTTTVTDEIEEEDYDEEDSWIEDEDEESSEDDEETDSF